MRKTSEDLSQDGRCPSQDPDWSPPRYMCYHLSELPGFQSCCSSSQASNQPTDQLHSEGSLFKSLQLLTCATNFSLLWNPKVHYYCIHKSTIEPYHDQVRCSLHLTSFFSMIYVNIILLSKPTYPSSPPWGLQTKICMHFPSPPCVLRVPPISSSLVSLS
jgi:hypothetical protein